MPTDRDTGFSTYKTTITDVLHKFYLLQISKLPTVARKTLLSLFSIVFVQEAVRTHLLVYPYVSALPLAEELSCPSEIRAQKTTRKKNKKSHSNKNLELTTRCFLDNTHIVYVFIPTCVRTYTYIRRVGLSSAHFRTFEIGDLYFEDLELFRPSSIRHTHTLDRSMDRVCRFSSAARLAGRHNLVRSNKSLCCMHILHVPVRYAYA